MKVAIIGVGGVGRTLAQLLRSEAAIDSLLLIDKEENRVRFFTKMMGRVKVDASPFDLNAPTGLPRVLRGSAVVVNTAPPTFNLAVMDACLLAGAHYIDVAASGPREPAGLPGILEQLQWHDAFRAKGLRALLSMGLDPGMSNVMAREAADTLDSIDAIRIRSGGTAQIPGYVSDIFPLYSRETFLSDMLLPPSAWSDGGLREQEPLSDSEDFEFPPPVGVQRTFLVSHEEVKTLPRYLGKPVRRVDFKQAFHPELIQAVLSLKLLGLLAEDRKISIGLARVPFRRAFLQALPEPSALVHPVGGAKALSVEAEGTARGTRKVERRDIVMDHREAGRRAAITAVIYLTAAAAAIGTLLIGGAAFPGPGVYPPEALDPGVVLREWVARNLPIARSSRSMPTPT
ncbi:MAG TPA: saccharopine dehydrogenase NADP-binding domain-containing protein [Thermoplasmata archaeon]